MEARPEHLPWQQPGGPRRIVLTGPESTGKTTLAQQLAAHWDTVWNPEHARPYYEALGTADYRYEHIEPIAIGQLTLEEALASQARHGLIFLDTDLMVIDTWSQHYFGRSPGWFAAEIARRHYPLYLLLDIDLPWVADGQRDAPHLRAHFRQQYMQRLEAKNSTYVVIGGSEEERLSRANMWVQLLLEGRLETRP